MSWAYRIVLVYAAFMAMIFYFLYVASQQDNQLMDDHYYEKEQQFINVVEGARNLDAIGKPVSVSVREGNVQISFPLEAIAQFKDGIIEFKCLSDQSKDLRLNMTPDQQGVFIIPATSFIRAQYQLRMEWISNEIPYAFREKFYYLRS
ncbi:MAG: FixH family protein [Saprospiraceae bacterium]|nr:FixH family protein [Saprospiraceae bacterium]